MRRTGSPYLELARPKGPSKPAYASFVPEMVSCLGIFTIRVNTGRSMCGMLAAVLPTETNYRFGST